MLPASADHDVIDPGATLAWRGNFGKELPRNLSR